MADGKSSVQRAHTGAHSGPARAAGRLRVCLFEPVDVASLAAFRAALGAIALWHVVRVFQHGGLERDYAASAFHFTYLGFAWLRPWPGAGMRIEFALLGALAALVAVGFCYRAAIALFTVLYAHVFLLERTAYENHLYLLGLFALLLVFVPAHGAFSVDAWLRPRTRRDQAPGWTLAALRAQTAIVYVFAGLAKLDGDWLRGFPLRIWLPPLHDTALVGSAFGAEWLAFAMSYTALAFEFLVVPLLVWHKTRDFAFVAVVVFHLTNGALFDVGLFPALGIASATLFYPPDWPRRALGRLRTRVGPHAPLPRPAREPLVLAGLALYLGLQLSLPLRHLLYPGNPNWTDEGQDFAWRMMICDKRAEVMFEVDDVASGRVHVVDPRDLLPERHVWQMSWRPDLIAQFAQHLSRAALGAPVRARVTASLNGRPPQPLVDSRVNLAAVTRRLRGADWIVPLRDGEPRAPSSDPGYPSRTSGSP